MLVTQTINSLLTRSLYDRVKVDIGQNQEVAGRADATTRYQKIEEPSSLLQTNFGIIGYGVNMRVGISAVQKSKFSLSPSTSGTTLSIKSGRPSKTMFGKSLEITVIGITIPRRLK